MAFDGANYTNMGTVGNNNAPRLRGYRSTDSLATILADAYFDAKVLDLEPGDLIAVHAAADPSGTLAASPFLTGAAASAVITVTHALHGLSTGNTVTFAAATLFDGIPAAELNAEHIVTVTDADTYTITVTTGATAGATSGGGTPTYTSSGGGTKHILQVDGKTTAASGAQSNVQTKVLGGGEDAASEGAVWLSAQLLDVSAAASRAWLAAPFDGYIRKVKTVLHGAITVADAAVGLEIGGTNVTGGQLTIATAASAAGDVDETTCTALNVVTEGQAVEIDTDGGSTDAAIVTVQVEFVPFSA